MENKLKNLLVKDFVYDLGSSKSVPGGGAATALVASMALALGNMASNFTLGKKKYQEYETDIKKAMQELDEKIKRFIELIDEDAKAFEPLSKAYALASSTEEEKKIKHEKMQEALKIAMAVPMEVFELACSSFDVLEILSTKASKLLVSDVGVGANFLLASTKASIINIEVNLKGIDDQAYKDEVRLKIDTLLKDAQEKFDRINENVWQRL